MPPAYRLLPAASCSWWFIGPFWSNVLLVSRLCLLGQFQFKLLIQLRHVVEQVNYELILGLVCSWLFIVAVLSAGLPLIWDFSSFCPLPLFSLPRHPYIFCCECAFFVQLAIWLPSQKKKPVDNLGHGKDLLFISLCVFFVRTRELFWIALQSFSRSSYYLHFAGGKWKWKWLSFVFVKLAKTKLSRANKLWQLIKMNYVLRLVPRT